MSKVNFARALSKHLRGLPPVAEQNDTRDENVAELASVLRKRRTRLRRNRWFFGATAAAALLVGTIAASRLRQQDAQVVARPVTLSEGTQLFDARGVRVAATNSVLLTPGSVMEAVKDSTASLPSGTRLTLRPATRVSVVAFDATQEFSLNTGALRADVAKLKTNERFLIRTDDAEVEVHGTSFEVSRKDAQPGCGKSTHVDVYEGVVSVRSGDKSWLLRAGDRWHSPCEDEVAAKALVDAPATSSAPAPAAAPHSTVRSSLEEENDLFAHATAAMRQGNDAAALALLDRLLVKYPKSTLTEVAMASRMRLLTKSDNVRGQVAALAYIKKFPNGPASAEARSLLGQ